MPAAVEGGRANVETILLHGNGPGAMRLGGPIESNLAHQRDITAKSPAPSVFPAILVLRTNCTRAEVNCADGADLATLKDRDVRLTFTGTHAKLHSFRFE